LFEHVIKVLQLCHSHGYRFFFVFVFVCVNIPSFVQVVAFPFGQVFKNYFFVKYTSSRTIVLIKNMLFSSKRNIPNFVYPTGAHTLVSRFLQEDKISILHKVTRQKHGGWRAPYAPPFEIFCHPFCYHVVLILQSDWLRMV
jgi:hypothetical protein